MYITKDNITWEPNDSDLGKQVIKEITSREYKGEDIQVSEEERNQIQTRYSELHKAKYPGEYEEEPSNVDEILVLQAQNKALTSRLEFTEDLIAELAVKIYD